MTIFYVLAALLLLGIMVTVHEAGHFLAARIAKIPVKQFAIGFGPKLVEWKSRKHETMFSLRLIPAGGFCAFYGEDETSGVSKNDPRNLANFSVPRRMFSIIMGPMMNFVLALVVCFGYYAIAGIPTIVGYGAPVIVSVVEGGAAQSAGIQAGDKVLEINGTDASGMHQTGEAAINRLINAYQEGDPALSVLILRGEEQMTFEITPVVQQDGSKLMGVNLTLSAVVQSERRGLWTTAETSWKLCVQQGGAILSALKKLIFKGEGLDQMAGPVGVISMIAQQTQANGFDAYLSLLVFISVNLGLVNLLPIPGLDGSRLVFLLVEGIRKKPLKQEVEAYIHLAGFGLFILLFIVLTWQDIMNLFH